MVMTDLETYGMLAFPACILLVSAVSAAAVKIPVNVDAALKHFAAGVVLSAVATELVPIMLEKQASVVSVSIGFVVGVVLLLMVRKTVGHGHGHGGGGGGDEHGHGEEHGHGGGKEHGDGHGHGHDEPLIEGGQASAPVNWGSVLPVLIDFMCDGLLSGLAFSAGEGAGLILVLSIALEMASVGAAVFQGMRGKGVASGTAFSVMVFLAVALFGSGALAFKVSDSLEDSEGNKTQLFYGLMSFGVAACLWLSGEDLLVEGHQGDDEASWVTAMFFLGFLLPVLLEKLGNED